MLNISIAAEKIGSIFGFPITNSLLATWFLMAVLIVFSWASTRKLSLVPTGIQTIAELIVGGLHDFFSSVTGHYIDKFFPLIASLFLFIITANWMGLLPGFSTIGFYHGEAMPAGRQEFIPLLRGATSDLNTTIALALIAVVAIQYFGFSVVGPRYGKKFLNLKDPISAFTGVLEFISEFSRIISFAFRLFGNIFAGEVLLAVIAFLMPFILPLPFLTLELFVGFIQALVFSMLTAVFLNVAVSHE
jgi:F-type H+-transporting ATPase subunit a